MTLLTTEELLVEINHRFHFNLETGIITCRNRKPKSRLKVGDVVGSYDKDGYIQVGIGRDVYRAHRLMWLHVYGELPPPEVEIDHINHIRDDNWPDNLRLSPYDSPEKNQRNRSIGKNNTSGCIGVRVSKGKWRVDIKLDGVKKYVGQYDEWWDAVCARMSANNKHGFHSNHNIPKQRQRQHEQLLAQRQRYRKL